MKALCYLFNDKSNLGDSLFVEVYKELFPELEFIFTDKITQQLFSWYDVLFIGGGSFLEGEPNIDRDLLEKLPEKPLIYFGIGAETSIHSWHKFLLKKARLVYLRSFSAFDKITSLNPETILCQDLVYALQGKTLLQEMRKKTILFLPNAHIISKWNSRAWKHSAWEYFKSECSQAFEELLKRGYRIDILPMCHNSEHQDSFAGIEIANKMISIDGLTILPFKEYDYASLTQIFSSYELVISQRYHGLVLADICKVPCINIHHHDKLKEFYSPLTKAVDFYRSSKDTFLSAIDEALFLKSITDSSHMGINPDVFKSIKDRVIYTLKE